MNKQKWIDRALELGLESFEIYQSLTSERSVTWYEGKLDTFTTSKVLGTSIRGVYQKKMANMAFEKIEDDQMDAVLQALIEQAKTISSNPSELVIIRFPEAS